MPNVPDDVFTIVWRVLRVEQSTAFDESTAAEGLSADGAGAGHRHRQRAQQLHCRRIACSVKFSELSGMLYSSFSSDSRVLLPRRRSPISIVLPVQIPWTC